MANLNDPLPTEHQFFGTIPEVDENKKKEKEILNAFVSTFLIYNESKQADIHAVYYLYKKIVPVKLQSEIATMGKVVSKLILAPHQAKKIRLESAGPGVQWTSITVASNLVRGNEKSYWLEVDGRSSNDQ